jgi:Tfp pilus assembly protein PilO
MSRIQMWAVVAVVAIGAVFAGGWFLGLSPQKSHVASLKAQAASQLDANQALQSQISVLKAQQSQLPAQQAKIDAIARRIPATPALPAYVRVLTKDAAAAHVELLAIAPQQPAPVTMARAAVAAPVASPAAGATAAAAAPAAPAASLLSAIPVTITVNGDYFAVQQFLHQLENNDRVTVVSTVAMQPGTLPQPQSQANASASPTAQPETWRTIQAQITATIFMSAAPPASAAGAGAQQAAPAPAPASGNKPAPTSTAAASN